MLVVRDGAVEIEDQRPRERSGLRVTARAVQALAARGWIHNRARLIVACFLTKDLHIDWRRGEAHFMRLLLCGDVAQNNGTTVNGTNFKTAKGYAVSGQFWKFRELALTARPLPASE